MTGNYVRFARITTKFVRQRSMSRRATTGLVHRNEREHLSGISLTAPTYPAVIALRSAGLLPELAASVALGCCVNPLTVTTKPGGLGLNWGSQEGGRFCAPTR